MNTNLATSLSGINAAATKLAVSANNVANSDSTQKIENGVEKNEVFVPSTTMDVSIGGANGGVKTLVNPVEPASFLKTNEGTTKPNVDFGQESVNQLLAKSAYKVNLLALEAQNKTIEQTLDIIS